MIYLERTITVHNTEASIDQIIYLYKGDSNIEVRFAIENNPFKNKDIRQSNYGQLIIKRKDPAQNIFSEVTKLNGGKVIFVITGDMIDELSEVGSYTFQIRLFNQDMTSRGTLPPIEAGIVIAEPLCEGPVEPLEPVADFYDIRTMGRTYFYQLFANFPGEYLDLNSFSTSNATEMIEVFANCVLLESLEIDRWDVSNVTSMIGMFVGCESLASLDLSNWNVSNVTNMDIMFNGCYSLTSIGDISNWDTSNVISMYSMFANCQSLTELDISNWDVSNADITNMFNGCSGLTSLDLNNWTINSNVTWLASMFYDCIALESLQINNWDVSHVTNMEYMFHRCKSLTELNLHNWVTSNAYYMQNMFANCTSLTTLDLRNFDTSNVVDMSSMFMNCSNVDKLNLSNFDMSNVTNTTNMFFNCAKLATLYLDNCSNDTISKIINSVGFPTGTIITSFGRPTNRKLYCKESEAAGLTLPSGWKFSYVRE